MPAYQITGTLVEVAVDTPTTLSFSTTTTNPAGNRGLSFLKIDNEDLTTASALTISLTAEVSALDYNNATLVAPGSTVFVQVAPAGYVGPVYVRVNGGTALWVQPVSIVG